MYKKFSQYVAEKDKAIEEGLRGLISVMKKSKLDPKLDPKAFDKKNLKKVDAVSPLKTGEKTGEDNEKK